ncbi:uncharacterized protein SPSK_08131 [Sporothrix schenckii 1099-18]|uniref:Uncharacterized protein n=1 Tax=Sporothrix schenckii 1099-18 TaxID=1397361 RepID=A0A0F2MF37_SPOSC|nr:uncharacterized protein SPSK_08131 [Sporothrix schenckii 1099-18]KJR88313.1 hypothetical protein SPSK_08131 [Sporothrix schenckii 1099-18]
MHLARFLSFWIKTPRYKKHIVAHYGATSVTIRRRDSTEFLSLVKPSNAKRHPQADTASEAALNRQATVEPGRKSFAKPSLSDQEVEKLLKDGSSLQRGWCRLCGSKGVTMGCCAVGSLTLTAEI